MSGPPAEPGAQALGESLAALAAQLADLRGQVAQVNQRIDRAGLRGDLDLVARFEEVARSVADTLDAAAPRGPTAPAGSAWTARHTWPSWPSCATGPTPCYASTTPVTSSGPAGPATSTPSGNCPRWPPPGITRTAPASRPGPRPGVLRPLAAGRHAPRRAHHPRMRSGLRHGPPPLSVTDQPGHRPDPGRHARLAHPRRPGFHGVGRLRAIAFPGPAVRPHHAPAGHRSQRSTAAGLSPGTITTATAAECPSHDERLKIQMMTAQTWTSAARGRQQHAGLPPGPGRHNAAA